MDLHALAHEYVTTSKFMQLATSNAHGEPWICTVNFVTDNDFNFYWCSARSRQHSQDILSNPKTAATVVKNTQTKQALQMSGEAFEVAPADLARVHQLYTGKFGPKDYDLEEMKKRPLEGRYYFVFKPSTIMFWDELNFPDAPKQVYER